MEANYGDSDVEWVSNKRGEVTVDLLINLTGVVSMTRLSFRNTDLDLFSNRNGKFSDRLVLNICSEY